MKHYISPSVTEQFIQNLGILCGSGGDRVQSDLGLHGGEQSGDVTQAY